MKKTKVVRKATLLAFFWLFMALLVPKETEGAWTPTCTTVVYVGGINTAKGSSTDLGTVSSPTATGTVELLLKPQITQTFNNYGRASQLCPTPVVLVHNQSDGLPADLLESERLVAAQNIPIRQYFLNESALVSATPQQQALYAFATSTTPSSQFVQNMSLPRNAYSTDQVFKLLGASEKATHNALVAAIYSEWGQNHAVLLLCHSEGNFFCNLGYRAVADDSSGKLASMGVSLPNNNVLSIIGVAEPADFVADGRYEYITACKDVIQAVGLRNLQTLPTNFPSVNECIQTQQPTLWQTLFSLYNNGGLSSFLNGYSVNPTGVTTHFISTYLASASATTAKIMQMVLNAFPHWNCGGDFNCFFRDNYDLSKDYTADWKLLRQDNGYTGTGVSYGVTTEGTTSSVGMILQTVRPPAGLSGATPDLTIRSNRVLTGFVTASFDFALTLAENLTFGLYSPIDGKANISITFGSQYFSANPAVQSIGSTNSTYTADFIRAGLHKATITKSNTQVNLYVDSVLWATSATTKDAGYFLSFDLVGNNNVRIKNLSVMRGVTLPTTNTTVTTTSAKIPVTVKPSLDATVISRGYPWATAQTTNSAVTIDPAGGDALTAYSNNLVGNYENSQYHMYFNTSFLGTNATVTDAQLCAYMWHDLMGDSQSVVLVKSLLTQTPTTSDGNKVDRSMELSNRLAITTTRGTFCFTLNTAGLSYLNKMGTTVFGLVSTNQVDNTAPNGQNNFKIMGRNTGSTYAEYLNLNYVKTTTTVVVNTTPTLTLSGANPLSITTGTAYSEPGFTATDTEDGNITNKVSVSGSVNTSTAGTYTLTYTVTDSGGLKSTASRTVSVVAPVVTAITATLNPTTSGTVIVRDPSFAIARTTSNAAIVDFKSGDALAGYSGKNGNNYEVSQLHMFYNIGSLNTSNITSAKLCVYMWYYPDSIYLREAEPIALVQSTLATAGTLSDGNKVVNSPEFAPRMNVTTTQGYVCTTLGSSGIAYLNAVKGATAALALNSAYAVDGGPMPTGPNFLKVFTHLYTTLPPRLEVTYTKGTQSSNKPPVITLNSNNPYYIGVGRGTYGEPGYIATDPEDGNLSSSVSVTGSVNSDVVGDYPLTYKVTDSSGNTVTVTRVVKVVTPAYSGSSLSGSCSINPSPAAPGALATITGSGSGGYPPYHFMMPGNLTGQGNVSTYTMPSGIANGASITLGGWIYDVWGTGASFVCSVTAGQGATSGSTFNTPPQLTLSGSTYMTLSLGQTYAEPGYTAIDAEDGNITSKVTVGGTVNTALTGTYTMTYSVADSGGLKVTWTRTVVVVSSSGGTSPGFTSSCTWSPAPGVVGKASVMTVSPNGGSSPYTFGAPSPYATTSLGNGQYSFIPGYQAPFQMNTTVTDSKGLSATASCTLDAFAPPVVTFAASCTANGSASGITVARNTTVNYVLTVTGGTNPDTFQWNGLGKTATTQSVSTSFATASSAGYNVNAVVTDASLSTLQVLCPVVKVN